MTRADLRGHVTQSYGVREAEFDRLFEEFAAFFDVTLEEFIRRRHQEMQRTGARNAAIYAALREEARQMRFAVRRLSERQVRRIIYG